MPKPARASAFPLLDLPQPLGATRTSGKLMRNGCANGHRVTPHKITTDVDARCCPVKPGDGTGLDCAPRHPPRVRAPNGRPGHGKGVPAPPCVRRLYEESEARLLAAAE
ncbi:hypothetical protein GCM10018980_19450 [Streptomyces capoamus]|uniref:Uncharacterized protein n=1 Tax=Streptomyces capoamus TaxID=68183 RepID=A0A919C1Y0_9ACTN|nr:hypothetical protein GCM10010501_33040 [Streptomyces libani subsp. rufus]GHG42969.1 hypothetical protein GCM10018980_19450 [Streptomyces capoamus]